MSSKLIKEHYSTIIDPTDECIVDLKIFRSGKVQLQAPTVHVKDLCKMLTNLSTDCMFESFQMKDQRMVEPVVQLLKTDN